MIMTKEERYFEKLQCRDFSKSKIQNIELIKYWGNKVLHVKVAVNNRVYTLDKYCKSFNYLVEKYKELKQKHIQQHKLNNMKQKGIQNA